MAEISTKPYLLRAIYEWCSDNGYTPHISVVVDEHTLVPLDHVKQGQIVLNISALATNRFEISNTLISFQARFSGAVCQISVPIENVSAIYARETASGMMFDAMQKTVSTREKAAEHVIEVVTPAPHLKAVEIQPLVDKETEDLPPTPPESGGRRPKLTRIK